MQHERQAEEERRHHFAPPSLEAGDERGRILEAIRRCGGHRGKAAALLVMSRATFYRKLAALGHDSKSDSDRA